ncbi:hypothetical protein QYE76_058438 [Lolium multiflorum]|uniref:DUF4220 domain-containing protein n=1 Tax=Lolium multiflorum TaxID=4521 RepID=A0AAD8T694_LOLMU|nr:hypothetical protein QYE76_058438 [Lolium multiflorum]
MGIKNTTANLAESFSSTEARLVRVEILVLFSFLSWLLLEVFCSYRRRFSHGFFRILVWTVYTLSTVLAPYTIGLLQAGPFRDQTFVLWGTILLLIQVNSDSLSVYSIQDIEQRKRMLVQQVLQTFLVLWLIVNAARGRRRGLPSGSPNNQHSLEISWEVNCHGPAPFQHISTPSLYGLVWHIVTTISWNEVSLEVPVNVNRLIAQGLSDYCAYLVAFIPDMLPALQESKKMPTAGCPRRSHAWPSA